MNPPRSVQDFPPDDQKLAILQDSVGVRFQPLLEHRFFVCCFELPGFVLGKAVVRPYTEHSHPPTLVLDVAVRRAARVTAPDQGEQPGYPFLPPDQREVRDDADDRTARRWIRPRAEAAIPIKRSESAAVAAEPLGREGAFLRPSRCVSPGRSSSRWAQRAGGAGTGLPAGAAVRDASGAGADAAGVAGGAARDEPAHADAEARRGHVGRGHAEYNEDPVFRALVSPTTFAARRRTIYIFHDRGPEHGVERLALGGSSQGGVYEAVRATATAPDGRQAELWGSDQWDLFADMVRERDPGRIAVNISHDHNFADGLSAGEWEQMEAALGADLASRVVREPLLAIEYLAMRVPAMTPVYRRVQAVVHEIIGTAFSEVVIVPGRTTTADVVWWMRQRVHDLGLDSWFQPSVSVQRRGADMSGVTAPVIERGDVLHCDFGLVAFGLATDTQHMAYVLREGETQAPAGLRQALANSNRLQDILLEETKVGRTGNEILASVLEKMRAEGLNGTMYTHPIGDHGHGAGPLIGLWDYQTGVPGRGDPPVIPGMWFSTELQVTTPVPEWDGQPVRMAQEEEAEITLGGEIRWMLRRQTELHLIR